MSNIEWTDRTWNPVIGCTPVSPGCLNCYAAAMARRLEGMGKADYAPRQVEAVMGTPYDKCTPAKTLRIAEVRGGRAVFTGEVRTLAHRLTEPLKWRKPCRVFVNSMSDLFHESVPFEFIDRVFAVMSLCPQHTFQVLTKRPDRMAEYFAVTNRSACVADSVRVLRIRGHGNPIDDPTYLMKMGGFSLRKWPLPNVWLGTSVENQAAADERIPHLLRCPAAVRFLSCEPLLEHVDLSAFFGGTYIGLPGDEVHTNYNFGINWVIVGGESGPGARPCEVDWVRAIIRLCIEAEVPCFVKQLGSVPVLRECFDPETCHGEIEWPDGTRFGSRDGGPVGRCVLLKDRKGGDLSEWPGDFQVREMPVVGGLVEGKAGGDARPTGALPTEETGAKP
jgi:protein gp37